MQTIIYILPELFLALSVMTLLMVGVFFKKSFKLVSLLTILCLIINTESAILTLISIESERISVK